MFCDGSYISIPDELHIQHVPQSFPREEQSPQIPAVHVWFPTQFPEPHD